MWQIEGKQITAPVKTPFAIDKLLVDYDGPRTFTVRQMGRLYLVHWCDEDERIARFIVAQISEKRLAELEMGVLPVQDALAGKCIILDLSADDESLVSAVELDYGAIPADKRPAPTATLPATAAVAKARS